MSGRYHVFIFVWVSLTWSAAADDIDIYFDHGLAGSEPPRLVLVVDWSAAVSTGVATRLPGVISQALERQLATWLWQRGRPAVEVALLVPRALQCGEISGCISTGWLLGEFALIEDGVGLERFQQQLVALAGAALTRGNSIPPYQPEEVYTALRQALQERELSDVCSGATVINLLFETEPTFSTGGGVELEPTIRSRFLVPLASPEYRDLAAAVDGKLLVASDIGAVEEMLANAMLAVLGNHGSVASATVPAPGPWNDSQLGEVYFPLFAPDLSPGWNGNLKKLVLVPDGSGGTVVAQAPLTQPPVTGVDPFDGGIQREALTFWTDPEGQDVRDFDPALGEVPGRDGRSVTRGGAGQRIPGFNSGVTGDSNADAGARQVYLLPAQAGARIWPLDADDATLQLLGMEPGSLADESLRLLRYIRGTDAFDHDGDGNESEMRPWLLGAVLHSRPAVVSYGARPGSGYSKENPDVRILFGSNDGFLHMLRNNAAALGAAEPGQEVWAAMPAQMLPLQRRLAALDGGTARGHAYGVDGSPVVSVRDRDQDGNIEPDEGDHVWVFFGLRRGGYNYYALDISDPDQPALMWQLSPEVAGFEQLALTFSTPRIAQMDLGEGVPRTVVLFAGGYNGGWRGGSLVGKDGTGTADLSGNAVYLVDAITGQLIWRAAGPGASAATPLDEQAGVRVPLMRHSIAAPVSAVDSNANGFVDRAYVADTGGNLWRIDLPEAGQGFTGELADVTAGWSVQLLAALGGGGVGESDRRFFHAVDYARTRDSVGDYDALLLVSGDRAHPRETEVRNFAYLVKDRGSAAQLTHAQFTDVTEICRRPGSQACMSADLSKGWRLALQGLGEKGLSRPLLRGGMVLFSSYTPALDNVDVCEPGIGSGVVYAIGLANAAPAVRELYHPGEQADEEMPIAEDARYFPVGSGIPGAVVPYREQLLLPGTGLEGELVVEPPGHTRWRIYWREQGVDVP